MPSLKIVFDTNVLISAFVFQGRSAKAIEYCITHTEVFISEWIFAELKEKLATKFKLTTHQIKTIEELLRTEFGVHVPTTKLPIVCRDADDNNILQLAESIKADFVITGDADLLTLKKFKSTRIVSPAIFLDEVC